MNRYCNITYLIIVLMNVAALGLLSGCRGLLKPTGTPDSLPKPEIRSQYQSDRVVIVPRFPRIPRKTGGFSGYGSFSTRKWDDRVENLLSGPWLDIKPANGIIEVPAGHALSFNIYSANNTDLASLDIFAPEDLQALTMPHSNKIDSRAMPHIGRLTGLVRLLLPSAKIRDEDLSHITGLPNLKALSLQSCPITDECVGHLSKIKSLEELNLWGTAITEKGYKKLKKLLPKCRIQWEEKLRKDLTDLIN